MCNNKGMETTSNPNPTDMRFAIHHQGEQVWPFNGKPPSTNYSAFESAVKRFGHKYRGNIITTTYDLDGNIIRQNDGSGAAITEAK